MLERTGRNDGPLRSGWGVDSVVAAIYRPRGTGGPPSARRGEAFDALPVLVRLMPAVLLSLALWGLVALVVVGRTVSE